SSGGEPEGDDARRPAPRRASALPLAQQDPEQGRGEADLAEGQGGSEVGGAKQCGDRARAGERGEQRGEVGHDAAHRGSVPGDLYVTSVLTDYHVHLREDGDMRPGAEEAFTEANAARYLEAAAAAGIEELGASEHIHRFEQALDIWSHP